MNPPAGREGLPEASGPVDWREQGVPAARLRGFLYLPAFVWAADRCPEPRTRRGVGQGIPASLTGPDHTGLGHPRVPHRPGASPRPSQAPTTWAWGVLASLTAPMAQPCLDGTRRPTRKNILCCRPFRVSLWRQPSRMSSWKTGVLSTGQGCPADGSSPSTHPRAPRSPSTAPSCPGARLPLQPPPSCLLPGVPRVLPAAS